MIGEAVTVLRRRESGVDAMGEPVFSWEGEEVDNCLVRPLEASEMSDRMHPDGARSPLCIAFPKSFSGGLRGARVALTGRGMSADPDSAYAVSGDPVRVRPCPTDWDLLAYVWRADG